MDTTDALAELRLLAAPEEDPQLTPEELMTVLDRARRPDLSGNLPLNTSAASAWAAATAYTVGTVVKQSPASGRYWRCRIAGTSATTQPSWPDLSARLVTSLVITDGSVVWEDAGGEWAPTWDLNAAAALAWRAKAAKASCRVDIDDNGQRIARRQVIATCLEMANRYRRRSGTLTTAARPFDPVT